MMKKSLISTLFTSAIIFNCMAQPSLIKKGYAFFTVSLPGNIIVIKGKTIPTAHNVERFIYVETKGSETPDVDSVIYRGIPVKVSIQAAGDQPFTPGIKKSNGQKIILTPQKGNHLWKITLQEITGSLSVPKHSRPIVIREHIDSRTRNFIINKEDELSTPDRY